MLWTAGERATTDRDRLRRVLDQEIFLGAHFSAVCHRLVIGSAPF
jgi:hypothetical protein